MNLCARTAVVSLLFAIFFQLGGASGQPPVQISAFPSGVGRYEPGKWASLGIEANNKTDKDAEGIMSVYFGKDPQTQFARRMWVPAKSTRRSWLPIRMHSDIEAGRDSIEMTMITLGHSDQGEVFERSQGDLFRTSFLAVDRETIKTAAIFRKPLPDERGLVPDPDVDAYEMLVQAKQLNEASRIILEFGGDFAPSHPIMWSSLDQFVVSADRIVDDTEGLEVLRSWLHGGGRLMVLLDRVSTDTVAAILGHGINLQVVDRVELDDFTIETSPSRELAPMIDRRRFEQPVEMVRVLTDATDVPFRVNSWPAAFWLPAGAGEILCVTLGPRGWLPAPIRQGDEKLEESTSRDFRSMQGLRLISDRFFQNRVPERETRSIVEPILQEQVGYQILSRSIAATLLGANAVALVGLGIWCSRRQRLDQLAWILPITALATTAVFLGIGRFNNRSVPSTVAYTQLVRTHPETEEAVISGLAGLYHQDATNLSMSGGSGGIVEAIGKPSGGEIRRFVWGDEDRGEWQNVELPGGSVQFVEFQKARRFEPRLVARFGPEGLEGRLEGKTLKLEDTVIANPPAPSLLVTMKDDGSFVSGRDEVLPANQFIGGQVLSDESRRRQTVYRHLVSLGEYQPYINRATLLGWSQDFDTQLDWPEDMKQTGTGMISIPLSFERTAPGTPFLVPATFFQIEMAASEAGRSMTFNPRTGEWVREVTRATKTRLRFPLPQQVLPCKFTSGHVSIKVNAPSRKLRVYSVVNGAEKLLEEIANPNGVYHIDATQPDQLPAERAEDALTFTFEITESAEELKAREDHEKMLAEIRSRRVTSDDLSKDDDASKLATSFTTWQIDYVRLDARGVTVGD